MTEQSSRSIPFRQWVGILGWILTLTAVSVGAMLIVIDVLWGHSNPYTGVVTYLVTPMIISAGVGLIFFSWVMRYRHRSKSGETERLVAVIDLTSPQHRQTLKLLAMGLTVFVGISAVGGYRSYHFTESTEFCGLTCHKVMEPEYITYHNSPHAKVDCVECHIGAGADWYVKSKMSGLYQVYAYTLGTYHLPIQTPIANLRPARETCEECHWPDKFSGNMEKTITHFMRDEENTPYTVKLLLKVGGGKGEFASGIHWHVSSGAKIEYVSTDRKRLEIPWVRMTDPAGKETIYTAEGYDAEVFPGTHEIRTMDCIDCHNRPSHIFHDPLKLVDEALATGRISRTLPSVKSNLMDLFEKTYESTEVALAAIEEGITTAYLADAESADATTETQAKKAIEVAKEIYSENFFPDMGVDWTTHPDFSGHFRWDGCYRCHGGKHTSPEGEVITNECNNCHVIIGQAEGAEALEDIPYGVYEFSHPMDMGPLSEGDKCTDCHEAPEPTQYPKWAHPETKSAQSFERPSFSEKLASALSFNK